MLVYERVKEIIAEELDHLNVDKATITPDTHFFDDLGCSLDFLEVILCCKEAFGISIPDAEAWTLLTVGKLSAYIEQKLDVGAWPPVPKVFPPSA